MDMEKATYKRSVSYDASRLTLRDMVGPIFRHRLVVAVTFTSIFLVSIYVAWAWVSHYYVATMQVVVGRERLDPAVTSQPMMTSGWWAISRAPATVS